MSQTLTRKLAPTVAGVVLALLVVGTAAGAVATTVSLDPAAGTLAEGDRTTVEVVVEDVDGGVGAYAAELSVADRSVARITDVTVHGAPDLENVTVSGDGSRARIKAALMQADGTGNVPVASVTLEGRDAGTTGIALSVSALGDRDGNSYSVAAAEDATLSVRGAADHDPPALSEETPTARSVSDPVATATPGTPTGSTGSTGAAETTPEGGDGPETTPAADSGGAAEQDSDGAAAASTGGADAGSESSGLGPAVLFVAGVVLATVVAAGLLLVRRR